MRTLIQAFPGDTVLVHLRYSTPERSFRALVLERTERYGYTNQGRDKVRPLLTVRNTETGKEEQLDMSYVQELIHRPAKRATQAPVNIYRDKSKVRVFPPICKGRGVWTGDLTHLAGFVLERSCVEVTQPISMEKIEALYAHQRCPGMVDVNLLDGYTVRMKAFRPWVLRNLSKITESASERHRAATEFYTAMDEEYYRELETLYTGPNV